MPTLATLNTDRRCNPRAVQLALRLARQTTSSTQLPVAERDEYVRCLIAYAQDTAAGHTPPESWQHRHLGHLIAA
ncbi:MAG: hypothetical protein ACRDT0_14105 [Pseudonocardiaceae bacterium]